MRWLGLNSPFFIGMTEILVPIGKNYSVILKNAFSSLTVMGIVRTQWFNRTVYTDYVKRVVWSEL